MAQKVALGDPLVTVSMFFSLQLINSVSMLSALSMHSDTGGRFQNMPSRSQQSIRHKLPEWALLTSTPWSFPHLSFTLNILFSFYSVFPLTVQFIRFLVTESSLTENHIPVMLSWDYSPTASISILGVSKLLALTFTISWFIYMEG